MREALKLDYQSDGRNFWAGMIVLAVGLTGMMFMAGLYQEGSRKVAQQEALAASVQNASTPGMKVLPVEKNSEQAVLEIKQANAVILELNLPWKELFEAFESSQQKDIAVLAIEPDAQKGLVRISGEAKSLDSLPAYIAYLQKIPLFQDVALLSHQIQDQDPQKPVRFMLQATWDMRR